MTDMHVKVPFGKYRNQCAVMVAEEDPQYCAWCLAQEWFPGKFPDLAQFWLKCGIRTEQVNAPDEARCTAIMGDGTRCGKWVRFSLLVRDEIPANARCGKHALKCQATTMAGSQCRNNAKTDSLLCGPHEKQSTRAALSADFVADIESAFSSAE